MSLEHKLDLLPEQPGVYLMKDRQARVIYVGKAVNLKNRVRSYFKSHNHPVKVQSMLDRVCDFEYIVTSSELEALALECNLIKNHRPHYNILLRDDKQYPYLKLTLDETYPRLLVTRRIRNDGARYFGPYTDVGALNETLQLLKKIFPLRTCSPYNFARRERPCLNHHIDRCLAPCQGNVSPEQYQEMVQGLTLFLEGRQDLIVKELRERMKNAADRLDFESAAELRDLVESIKRVLAKQTVVSLGNEDQDIVAMAQGVKEACVQVFQVRSGKLLARETFSLQRTAGYERREIITAFLKDYYSRAAVVPPLIILSEQAEEQDLLQDYLTARSGRKVVLHIPQRGPKRALAQLAEENAVLALRESEELWAHQSARTEGAVAALQSILELPSLPSRIEGFDVSNIQGREPVASMVVFEDGKPRKSDYRKFRIRTVFQADDFAMMAEAVKRRYSGSLRDKLPLPDMILIDGGKGQLSTVCQTLRELGLERIPVFGLAEKLEQVYLPHRQEPLELPRDSVALQLLQQVRDEAHRFALEYHRSLRRRSALRSELDEVPGIGSRRRQALIRKFGSLKEIQQASLEELIDTPGLTRPVAEALYRHLHN